MKHFQTLKHSRAFPFMATSDFFTQRSEFAKKRAYSLNISVDQFFSQSHRLRNGDIDTSPAALAEAEAQGHFEPTVGRSLPVDTPVSDIFPTIISKSCQSLSEVSQLAKLRPVVSDGESVDPVPEPVPEPTSEPS